jgi:hypothetical protein
MQSEIIALPGFLIPTECHHTSHVLFTPYLNAFGGSAEAQISTPTMIYMLARSYLAYP